MMNSGNNNDNNPERTFYHVTKKTKVKTIRNEGLKRSTGLGAGGMSSDSGESYKYSKQDTGFVYLAVSEEDIGTFNTENHVYALIIVKVKESFVKEHMGPKYNQIGEKITDDNSTAVCDADIPSDKLFYKKEKDGEIFPLSHYGTFNKNLGNQGGETDYRIWDGESDDDDSSSDDDSFG